MAFGKAHAGRLSGTYWDPGQYLKFGDHRLRPALELLARVTHPAPEAIVDLGCGAGQVTRVIAERWPRAKVLGVDHSREMLAEAAAQPGGIHWVEADIRTWSPGEGGADLIYSNAALHWVEAHPALFARLIGFLNPAGCLAVQMPLSWELPSHRIMRETLSNGGPGGAPLGPEALRTAAARRWVEAPQAYYDLLAGRTRSLDIWQTEYLQTLRGDDPVLEWAKGTALRPILNGLEAPQREIFLTEYARRLRAAYPAGADGVTLYPFRRLFIVATV